MKTYMAMTAFLAILATTAFGRVWAAAPTGLDKAVAFVAPADSRTQASWIVLDRIGHQTPTALAPSTTLKDSVVLTAGQRRGGMHGGGTIHGGFAGHANTAQGFHATRPNMSQGFNARPFGGNLLAQNRPFHRDFDRNRSFHQDFDRDRFHHRDFDRDRFFHRGFDRDDFFFHRRFYPYNYYYYPYGYYPYNYYYPYGYNYYPYGSYYYGNPWYMYPYPNSYFYFSW